MPKMCMRVHLRSGRVITSIEEEVSEEVWQFFMKQVQDVPLGKMGKCTLNLRDGAATVNLAEVEYVELVKVQPF